MSVRGWVYVISNASMPGIVKVGYSLKDPILRAEELNNTGAPLPYKVEWEVLVDSPLEIEQQAHSELSTFREGKEWFRCSVKEAVQAIRKRAEMRILYEPKAVEEETKLPPREKLICRRCGKQECGYGNGKYLCNECKGYVEGICRCCAKVGLFEQAGDFICPTCKGVSQ